MLDVLKRSVAGLLAAFIAFTATFVSVPTTYAQTSSWAANYVKFMQDSGFVNSGEFNGTNSVTRAQLAKMVYEAGVKAGEIEKVDPNTLTEYFTDVKKNNADGSLNWQHEYVNGLRSMELLSPNAAFRPDDNVTREEAAAMLARVFGLAGAYDGASMFSDVPKTHYAYDSIHNLATEGIINGIGGGKYGVGLPMTREAVAKVVTGMYILTTEGMTLAEYFKEDTSSGGEEEEEEEETTTPPVAKAGQLEVRLSSTTPASANIPNNASSIPVTKLDLTASYQSDVTLNSLTLRLQGLVNSSDISRVWVTDETGVRLGNLASMTSENFATLTFPTSPVIIRSGSTKTLTVLVSLASSVSTGKTFSLGLASASDVTSTAEKVVLSGSIYGNLMSTSGYQMGTFTFTPQATSGTYDIGSTGVEIGRFQLSHNDNSTKKNALLQQITLRNEGTATLVDSVEKLYLDYAGQKLTASAVLDGRYVHFSFANGGFLYDYGKTKSFTIRGDIVGATSNNNTLQFRLQRAEDLVATEQGSSFGVNTPTIATLSGQSTAGQMSEVTIKIGDVTVSKNTPSMTDSEYSPGDSDVVLLEAKVLVAQNIRFTGVKVRPTASSSYTAGDANSDLNNIRLYANDVLIDSAEYLTLSDGTLSTDSTSTNLATTMYYDFDTTFDISKTTVLKLVANIDSSATASNAYKFSLAASDFTSPEYVSTGDSVASTALIGSTTGHQTTITSSSLTFTRVDGYSSSYSTPENITVGSNDVTLFKFTVKANNSSDVNLSSVTLTYTGSTGGNYVGESGYTSDVSLVTNMGLYLDGVQQGSLKSLNSASFNDINVTIPKGGSKTFVVKGTLGSSLTADFLQLVVTTYTAINVKSGDSLSTSGFTALNSGVIGLPSAGIFYVNAHPNQPLGDVVVSNTANQKVMGLEFKSKNDAFYVSRLFFTATDSSGTNLTGTPLTNFLARVSAVKLLTDGGDVIDTQSFTTYSGRAQAYFNLGSAKGIQVAKDGSTKVYLALDFNPVTRAEDTGLVFKIKLDSGTNEVTTAYGIEAISVAQSTTVNTVGSTAGKISGSAISGNTMLLAKSKPTVTAYSPQVSTFLSSDTRKEVMKFTVKADEAGSIELNKVSFTVNVSNSNSTGSKTVTGYVYEAGNSTDVLGSYALAQTLSSGGASYDLPILLDDQSRFERISAGTSKTYVLKLDLSSLAFQSGSTVSVTMNNDTSVPSGAITFDDGDTSNDTNNFVWSDMSDVTHAYGTDTTDFFTGYRIKDLPLTHSLSQ